MLGEQIREKRRYPLKISLLDYRIGLAYRHADPAERIGPSAVGVMGKMRLRYRRYAEMEDRRRERLL